MGNFDDDIYSNIFFTLKNPMRRKILRLLFKESLSYTSILTTLKVSTGLLNHHIGEMEQLLSKDDENKYCLNPFGIAAFNMLLGVENPDYSKKPIKLFNLSIKFIHITLVIILALILITSYLANVNNQFYSKEKLIINNRIIEIKVLFNRVIIALDYMINSGMVDIYKQKSIMDYTIKISFNLEEIIELAGDNVYLLQVKNSIDELDKFNLDWSIKLYSDILMQQIALWI